MAKNLTKSGPGVPMSHAPTDARWRPIVWAAVAAVLAFGLIRAIQIAWVCDDAFISFRYAKNLLAGHGLVYNVGEVVEGYSNFLWTVLMAAGMRLGADPVRFSEILGTICYAATIFLLVRTSVRSSGEQRRVPVLPLAAMALSLHPHFRTFASGGLETPLFALEMTALIVLLVQASRPRDHLATGLVAVAMAMTRPDGMFFYALAGAVAAHDSIRGRSWKPLLNLLLPGVVLYLPYFVWRLHYYGYLFPNTFYAKGSGRPYVGQGLLYVGMYLRCYYVLALGLVAIPALHILRWRRSVAWPSSLSGGGSSEGVASVNGGHWSGLRAPAVLLVFAAGNLFFVIWTGGDFMFARFLIPATPLIFLGLELLVMEFPTLRWRLVCVALVLLATVVTSYPRQITDLSNPTGIVEERSFYPRERIQTAQRLGERLKNLTKGTDTRVAIYGMQAMLAYYAEFPVAIEGEAGLTDKYVAHLPLRKRSRIGHEKRAPVEYLRERGVDFVFAWPGPIPPIGFSDIDFGGIQGQVVTYRKDVMDHLKGQPGVRFLDVEAYLRDRVRTLSEQPVEKTREEYAFWRSVYFQHNNDPELEAAFTQVLERGELARSIPAAEAPPVGGNPPDRP
jgi:hypothetical protein